MTTNTTIADNVKFFSHIKAFHLAVAGYASSTW